MTFSFPTRENFLPYLKKNLPSRGKKTHQHPIHFLCELNASELELQHQSHTMLVHIGKIQVG